MIYLFLQYSKMEYIAWKREEYMGTKKKHTKVLIVDDRANIREMFSYILEERGFIAEVAKDGKEAVQKVAQDKPNIIVLDVTMPEMDGLQACKQLRENPDTQDIPIIFLSAQRHVVEVIQDIPGAAIEFIEKPCDIEYLFERINSLITKREST